MDQDFRQLPGPQSKPFEEPARWRQARESRDAEPRHAPGVYDDVLGTIGATPVVRLSRLEPPGGAQLLAKAEQLQPTGSVKDRICLAMIEAAERDGRLAPGGVVVEPTSGNTGIGLALVCAVKGYRCVLTMPASMSLERRALLKAFGAEVVLTEPEQGMEGAIRRAHRVAKERGAFLPHQFENRANPEAHRRTTAAELLEAVEAEGGGIDAFVAGVGTGGTVTGVGQALRERWPGCLVVAVEPESNAVLAGHPPGPSKIQGLGAGFVPAVLDPKAYQRVMGVSDRDAWAMKERLGREEGLLVGISSGAAVAAAVRVAQELGPGKRVYTVLADTGERYFSMAEFFK